MEHRLKELRKEKHLTQQALATMLGVATNTVGSWEVRGEIPAAYAYSISLIFGVTMEYLYGLSNARGYIDLNASYANELLRLKSVLDKYEVDFSRDFDCQRELLLIAMLDEAITHLENEYKLVFPDQAKGDDQ